MTRDCENCGRLEGDRSVTCPACPDHKTPFDMASNNTTVKLNAEEVQTLISAMAGEFPEHLAPHRWELLLKLSKAHYQIKLGLREQS